MTSTITIGRVGIDIPMSAVTLWEDSDGVVNVSGRTPLGSIANALVLRQQLSGYVGSPDEDFVPVTWSLRPYVNGFYRLLSATVTPTLSAQVTGWFDFSLVLQPVQGYAAPSFESVILGALRANAAGIVTGTSIPWQGLPAAATFYDCGVTAPTVKTRAGVDGSVSVFSDATNVLYNARPSFFLAPASWYSNAATLKVGGSGGSGGNVAVGRQITNSPMNWELGNGLIRVWPSLTGSQMILNFQSWSGSAWVTFRRLRVGTFNNVMLAPAVIAVLRNSPEEVTIRFSFDVPAAVAGTYFGVNLDMTVRRGSRMVTGVITSRVAQQWGMVIHPTDPLSVVTLITGGVRLTSNDASGNRFVLASSVASTYDGSVIDIYYATSATTRWDFAVGNEITGSSATGTDAAQSMIYQYMAAQAEKVTVVAR